MHAFRHTRVAPAGSLAVCLQNSAFACGGTCQSAFVLATPALLHTRPCPGTGYNRAEHIYLHRIGAGYHRYVCVRLRPRRSLPTRGWQRPRARLQRAANKASPSVAAAMSESALAMLLARAQSLPRGCICWASRLAARHGIVTAPYARSRVPQRRAATVGQRHRARRAIEDGSTVRHDMLLRARQAQRGAVTTGLAATTVTLPAHTPTCRNTHDPPQARGQS